MVIPLTKSDSVSLQSNGFLIIFSFISHFDLKIIQQIFYKRIKAKLKIILNFIAFAQIDHQAFADDFLAIFLRFPFLTLVRFALSCEMPHFL
jgi:hypothetical protein